MGKRVVGWLRAAWLVFVVTVTCVVLSIPVFLGVLAGRGGGGLPIPLVLWFRSCFRAAGIVPVIRGGEHIDRLGGGPLILVGNHQSALDIPLVSLACRGRIRFLAKKSLFWIPIVGWVMKFSGFTAIDRRSARKTRPALEKALHRIPRGRECWIIFPEGTRSVTGELLPYHRGTFNFARQAGVPVVPFAIHGARDLLPKGAWIPRAGTMTLVIGEPVPADEVRRLPPDDLLGRARAFTAATLASLRHAAEAPGTPGAGS